ncbi:MAG: oligosaccharide flippase family protein [Cetobacterium sp.]
MNITKTLSLYMFSNILSKLSSVIILIILTNVYSPSEYGVITLANTYLALFITFFTFGMNGGVQRFYYEINSIERRELFGFLLKKLLFLNFIVGSFLVLIFINTKLFNGIPLIIFVFVIILGVMKALESIGLSILQMKSESKRYAKILFLTPILDLIFVYIFIYKMKSNITIRFIILTIATLITQIVLYFFIKSDVSFKKLEKIDKNLLNKILNYCIPVIFLPIVSWLLTSTDRIMISKILNFNSLGIYSFGFALIGNLNVVITSFFTAFYPVFLKNYEDKNFIRNTNTFFYIFFINILIFFMIGFQYFGKYIFKNLKYLESVEYLPYFGLWSLVYLLYSFYSNVLIYKYMTKVILNITIVSGVSNVILNFIMIKIYGMEGAIYSSIISINIQLILAYIILKKKTYTQLKTKEFLFNSFIYLLFIVIYPLKNYNLYIIMLILNILGNFKIILEISYKIKKRIEKC